MLLARAGSLRLTLYLLALFLLCILLYLSYNHEAWLISAPLLLLTLNLLAAIITSPTFRRSRALLSFHLSLLSLLTLVATGQLTQLQGHAEVTSGESFDGLVSFESGPWHSNQIENVRFTLERLNIEYSILNDTLQRDTTRAHIRYLDYMGVERNGFIGDHTPLILYGYRFYTTPNKGFAPYFSWQPANDDKPRHGSIHLPAYPAHKNSQALEWNIPGTEHQLWTQLQFDEEIPDPEKPSKFHTPSEHILVVRRGEQRDILRPGQTLHFNDGQLTYEELRTWMGFTVFSDWTLPWLFAAGLLAVLSLGWHYWQKFSAKPWLQEETN